MLPGGRQGDQAVIEIPDEINKLKYQDFKFDVPAHGAITFKIIFVPDVSPNEFPLVRERRTRKPMPQGTELKVVMSVEVAEEAAPGGTARRFAPR